MDARLNHKFSQRANGLKNPLAKALLALMEEKQTNLSVAVDLTNKADILALVDKIGPFVCVIKTHVDVIEDFDQDFIQQLTALSEKHRFYIFEDRKFADIGNTVKLQYSSGVYKIASWAHITNCHTVPGEGIVQGLKEVGLPLGRGLLLLAEMSSKGSLATGSYTQTTLEWAEKHNDFCIGFIAGRRFPNLQHDFITMSPGIGLDVKGDGLGQQYRTPHEVIVNCGSDIIIVGRGIYGAGRDPVVEAQRYKQAGWNAYQERLSGK
ncbi:orotidine 5'-phosphate decarboxylase Ura4 [Schizosaccharomyces cryophilus OY26]|uniref:Orotidine 5'-phosphate decarboxylase n=1 Tax=Schizosaccharomyces cryophilus (strain OY26 / ATCC MYA-4695 / CBS 11777 / NBRC 106824 / NRRL Y48691) TaxID=653667 RepID=S9VUX7_SCHCR|nr:orotidine 5'-phosphate decarboxylase Ura4 [Schizosaccharomyces cryophilus OY26]EPY51593.1 orotidine 5'-phosphate decarboxylase Ura4 [Schizosaccharomyces cryophilus OY26]